MNDDLISNKPCRRRGRPRIRRHTETDLRGRCYKPCSMLSANNEIVILGVDELEILRLIDLNGLTQEEAAVLMGISRRSLWRDLHEARRKVTDALVNGKTIEFEGCDFRNEKKCFFSDIYEKSPSRPDTEDDIAD